MGLDTSHTSEEAILLIVAYGSLESKVSVGFLNKKHGVRSVNSPVPRSALQTIGQYELLEKIAEGGMGAVYKARNNTNDEIVAIKIVPPHLAKNTVLLKRFEKEYNAASLLNHTNIVRALDFGFDGESPYLVMEFVDGETLGDRLEREGKLPEVEAIKIIAQVAQGLHKAHKQGMIHRDVKPDNILITPDGVAKLADLGLVKELETDLNLTRTGRGLGTPHFMAPEQFRNAKNADVRCDIYSLGATLYMMVTGELPFKSLGPLEAWMKKIENKITPPIEIDPTISERIDWAIRRAMAAEADDRPSSCREFIEDLTGHSTKRLQTARPSTSNDIWYLRYRDDDDVVNIVKGSKSSVRQSLRDGILGDASNVRASRDKNGPFEPLKNHPEFRDIVLSLRLSKSKPSRKSIDSPIPRRKSAQTPRPEVAQSERETVAHATHTPIPASGPTRRPATNPAPKEPYLSPLPEIPISENPPPNLAPHFQIENTESDGDWGKFVVLIVLALIAGMTGFFLMPYISQYFQ